MARYVLCYPNEADGGTSLLMARLAQYLVMSGAAVRVVDFANGAIARHLRGCGLKFEHTLPATYEVFTDEEIVVTILLHAKHLTSHFRPAPGTRFLFWSTQPNDGMALVPTFNLLLRRPRHQRPNAMRALHPRYRARVARFLETATDLNGLAYMDSLNWETNRDLYNLRSVPHFLPVMTAAAATTRASWGPGAVGSRVVWIGRLAHLKVRPLESLIRALDAHVRAGGSAVSLDVIGGGEQSERVARVARGSSVSVRFHGALSIIDLEARLGEGADLVVGHGMSVLEGARLGIPCLLIDAWEIDVPDAVVRVRWLQNEGQGEVGRVIESPSQLAGVPFAEALASWQRPGALAGLGEAALEHWRRTHTLEAVGQAALAMLEANTLSWKRIQETGFHQLDLVGRATQAAKARYHAWRGGA